MFKERQYNDGNLLMHEVINEAAGFWMRFCPERGGILTGCGMRGEELFYMDSATLHDPQANIRGGVPVLFPVCGQLEGGRYEWNGAAFSMSGHGFARDLPWEVETVDCGKDEATVTLRLDSSERTRALYPFDFTLIFTYRLLGNRLLIEQEYHNRSSEPMPMYAGLHPYYAADDKRLRLQTDATKYDDRNDGKTKAFDGLIDLSGMEQAAVLLDAKEKRVGFEPRAGRRITMEAGTEFKYIVLWSVIGKPFVCVEPFMAQAGELNRQQELVMVAGGDVLRTSVGIRCDWE